MKRSLSPSPEDAALQPEDLQVEEQGVPSATAKPKTKKSTPSQSSVADKKKGKHWPRKQVQKEGRSENEGDGGDSDGDDQVTSPKSTPKKAKTKQTSSSPSGQDPAGLGYPVSEERRSEGTYPAHPLTCVCATMCHCRPL